MIGARLKTDLERPSDPLDWLLSEADRELSGEPGRARQLFNEFVELLLARLRAVPPPAFGGERLRSDAQAIEALVARASDELGRGAREAFSETAQELLFAARAHFIRAGRYAARRTR
jgi:hypothetical protein